MNTTSLQHKTVRPGSLLGYSYYHSKRQPVRGGVAVPLRRSGRSLRRWATLAAIAMVVLLGVTWLRSQSAPTKPSTAASVTPPKTSAPAAAPAPAAATNHCTGNQLDRLILVSIGSRHLWACQAGQTVYDSPVVTGIDYLDADKTPTGTYHIYGKQTDLTLTGADSTGSWSDPVQYWMPFLHNQYGSYGFHDATWRDNNAFGNISPNSADASHGCVELPLGSAQWLYGWATIDTTVTVKS